MRYAVAWASCHRLRTNPDCHGSSILCCYQPKDRQGGRVTTAAEEPGGYSNANLSAAKVARQNEFYTQWADIEREMNAYLEYDPDVFRGKTILLPCDDPEWSNFAKFFALHFTDYGIKKLISTSYAADSKPPDIPYQPTLFEAEDPKYDAVKSHANGKKFVLEAKDLNGDGVVNIDDLRWEYLDGDGDFRSAEVTALRDEADIVITNPPFSLFREFLAWLVDGGVRFSIIGSTNATTYKEVFPLIRENRLWKGATANNTDMVFGVPKGTPIKPADQQKAERLGYPSTDEYDFTRLGNSCWFTNIEHGRRHEAMQLMSMADNKRFSKHKELRGGGYRKYDNYDAIEVPYTDAIPCDYDGVMGVPISFLDKYNPDQFEILGRSHDIAWAQSEECYFFTPPPADEQAQHRKHDRTWRVQIGYTLDERGRAKCVYQRLFIRHRKAGL